MNEPEVLRETRGSAYWITINRPSRRNALTSAVISGISAAVEAAEADPGIRVIVLTGAGDKAFCAGADLEPGKNFAFDYSKPTVDYADLARQLRGLSKPSVACVNGACVAGGMGFLGMTNLVVAAEHAVFGLPEVRVGLYPMQVIALLKDIVPARLLQEWCLTGERFDALAALSSGLVNYVVPAAELDEKVESLVNALVAGSPTAQRRGLYASRAVRDMSWDEALAFAESQIALVAATEDALEGREAFAQKRTPKWKGR
jgi:enoyl-CoA hydratase/carnithine racemase